MAQKNLMPKVKQLEQLRVEFDDANSAENQGALPQQVNSRKKFDIGPTNNVRQTVKRKGQSQSLIGQSVITSGIFGFKDKEAHEEEDKASDHAFVNQIFQPA